MSRSCRGLELVLTHLIEILLFHPPKLRELGDGPCRIQTCGHRIKNQRHRHRTYVTSERAETGTVVTAEKYVTTLSKLSVN